MSLTRISTRDFAKGKSRKPHQNLRTAWQAGGGQARPKPAEFIQSLEQLRSLVRSALSALTPSEGAAAGAIGPAHLSFERIISLGLEKSVLPHGATKDAHELLDSLGQHVGSLSALLDEKAPVSDISNVLIKVNTTARNLALTLAQSSGAQMAQPPALKHH
jgi:hypothetical protein